MIDKKNQCDADPFDPAGGKGDQVVELAKASVSLALAANDCEWRRAA